MERECSRGRNKLAAWEKRNSEATPDLSGNGTIYFQPNLQNTQRAEICTYSSKHGRKVNSWTVPKVKLSWMSAFIRKTNVSIIIALWMIGTVQFRHQTCKKRREKKLCSAITGEMSHLKNVKTLLLRSTICIVLHLSVHLRWEGKDTVAYFFSLLAVLPWGKRRTHHVLAQIHLTSVCYCRYLEQKSIFSSGVMSTFTRCINSNQVLSFLSTAFWLEIKFDISLSTPVSSRGRMCL